MNWGRVPLVALASLAVLSPRIPAQETAPPRMVIRTESRMVLVDAVVRDKKGKIVRDLGAHDFRLWEDGKEQSVASFSLESTGTAPEAAQKQYLLLLFDNSSGPQRDRIAARRDAAQFVSAWAGPDRYMAVVSFHGVLAIGQNFTVKPAPLVAAIGGMPDSPESTDVGNRATPQFSRNSLNRPDSRGSSKPADDVLAGISSGQSTITNSQASAQPSANSPSPRKGLLEAVMAVAESMASIRGRKSVAVIGFGGADSPDPMILADAIGACNRANVGVYVTNQTGLKQLAEETGGRVLANTHDLAAELGKVAEEQDEHYILGYTPAESPHDCHGLRVAVTRPGLEVRARKGYCNTKPVEALTADPGKAVETRAAATPGNMRASLLLPYFYVAPNLAKVSVAMEIAAAAIPFAKVKGKPHAELSVVGIADKPDGAVGGRFRDIVNLDFENDKDVEAFRRQPLHYEYQFDLPPGDYKLQVVFDAGGQNFGKAEGPLRIDPWDGRSFAMSALALVKEIRPVADLAAALDDSLLEDRRPLIARSIQVVPSGSNRFQRGEPGHWYAEIYTPQAGAAAAGFQVRILDRETGNLKVDSGVIGVADYVRPGSPVIPVALDIPVNLLAPGSYRLEVKAMQPGSGSVMRTADFEVEK